MKTRKLLRLWILWVVAVTPNIASGADATPAVTAVERNRIAVLIEQAVSAGRKEAETAYQNARLSEDERNEAQSQYAFLLLRSGNCDASKTFIAQHTEIPAYLINRLAHSALSDHYDHCAVELAELMLERLGALETSPQRAAYNALNKFEAGAILAAAGEAAGQQAMNAAEARITSLGDGYQSLLWEARFNSLAAYRDGPTADEYLKYLADKMVAEHLLVRDRQKARSIFAVFAAKRKCGLVERVVGTGPRSCDQAKADADAMYLKPSAFLIDQSHKIADLFDVDTPSLDEDGIKAALSKPTAWQRLTGLVLIVSKCRKYLAQE